MEVEGRERVPSEGGRAKGELKAKGGMGRRMENGYTPNFV